MLNNTDDIKNAENKNMENKLDTATTASAETIENQSEPKQPAQKSNKDGDIKIKKTENVQRDVGKEIQLSDSLPSEKKTEAKTMTDSSEKKIVPSEDKQSSTSPPLEKVERRTTVREGRKNYSGRATSAVASSREAGSSSASSGGKSNIRHSRGFRPRYRRQPLDTRDLKIDFLHPEVLQRFISRTGKILPQRVTGAKPAVQRKIAREIKRARHIGLLPYTHR